MAHPIHPVVFFGYSCFPTLDSSLRMAPVEAAPAVRPSLTLISDWEQESKDSFLPK